VRLLGGLLILWLGALGLALMLAAGWAGSEEFGCEAVKALTLGVYVPVRDVHATTPRLVSGFVLLGIAVVLGKRANRRPAPPSA
jgi:hypothetical protein